MKDSECDLDFSDGDTSIPIEFYCYVPNPRLKRIITQRDKPGRIVYSRSPALRA